MNIIDVGLKENFLFMKDRFIWFSSVRLVCFIFFLWRKVVELKNKSVVSKCIFPFASGSKVKIYAASIARGKMIVVQRIQLNIKNLSNLDMFYVKSCHSCSAFC